jgi:hypothetical protein
LEQVMFAVLAIAIVGVMLAVSAVLVGRGARDRLGQVRTTVDRYKLTTTNANGTDSCSGVYDGWDEVE